MATSVKISARILHFPTVCCCCGSVPEMKITATSTRVTGKRVVRSEQRSWPFPICSACYDHSVLFAQADGDRVEAARLKTQGVSWIVVGVLLSACVVGLPFLVMGPINLLVQSPAKLAAAIAGELRAERYMSKRCRCRTDIVVYHEWAGTVHSFEFGSDDYARAFVALNRAKVVSWDRTPDEP